MVYGGREDCYLYRFGRMERRSSLGTQDLRDNAYVSKRRDIRTGQSNAALRGFHHVKHRRRFQPAIVEGKNTILLDGTRIVDGIAKPVTYQPRHQLSKAGRIFNHFNTCGESA